MHRDAEFIDVGKKPYAKHIQQDEINLKSLKRLKVPNSHSSQRWRSGIFGRVTEEVNTLKDYGIEYEIVPGVTAVHLLQQWI